MKKHIITSICIAVLTAVNLVAQTTPSIAQQDEGTVTLPASKAVLNIVSDHSQLKYASGDGKDNIDNWGSAKDTVSWTFTVKEPGKFKVTTEISAMKSSNFELVVGDKKVQGTSPATGGWTNFQKTEIKDTLEIPAGTVTLTVKPIADGWNYTNLKSIKLTLAK
jgi:Carbohydrate binding module (family 35)